MEKKSKLGTGCLVVIVVCIAIAMGFAFMGESTNRNVAEDAKAAAPPVIEALERYKAAKKEYPTTLDQMVPEFLPAVPQCKLGDDRPRMAYRLEEPSGPYELVCPASTLMRYRYRSATGQWDLTD